MNPLRLPELSGRKDAELELGGPREAKIVGSLITHSCNASMQRVTTR